MLVLLYTFKIFLFNFFFHLRKLFDFELDCFWLKKASKLMIECSCLIFLALLTRYSDASKKFAIFLHAHDSVVNVNSSTL